MNSIDFLVDSWHRASDSYSPEYVNITYANIRITCGNLTLTEHEDIETRLVSDSLCIPVYYLAEWIAQRWFSLTEEPNTTSGDIGDRHDIVQASSGFPLPDVSIFADRPYLLFDVREWEAKSAGIRFLANGRRHVLSEDAIGSLKGFLDLVCQRLHQQGIFDSPFQSEWDGINNLTSDELQYARLCGMFGLDPFDESDYTSELSQLDDLPISLIRYLAEVYRLDDIKGKTEIIKNDVQHLSNNEIRLDEFGLSSGNPPKSLESGTPWRSGWEMAALIREKIGGPDALGNLVDLIAKQPTGSTDPKYVQGLVDSEDGRMFCVLSQKSHHRFEAARALFDAIAGGAGIRALTSSFSRRQQQSRAFAAEVTAPLDRVRELVNSTAVDSTQLGKIARKLNAPLGAVRHQIENHNVAHIYDYK